MKVIDLCSGGGGLSLGFQQAGFEIVFAIDNWYPAWKTHKINFPNCETVLGDIMEYDGFPEADVVVGGPPCPEFSVAKYWQAPESRNDPTYDATLVERCLEIAKDYPYYVFENVRGLKKIYPEAILLNAAYLGVNQNRIRAFLANFELPKTPLKYRPDAYPTVCGDGRYPKHKYQVEKFGKISNNYHRKRIQGFPESFKFIGTNRERRKMINNAVPPPMAKAIAESLKFIV